MQRLSEWPIEWQKTLLCTEHWQYNGECHVWHNTSPMFELFDESEEWVSLSHHFGVTSDGPQKVEPLPVMYDFCGNVLSQLEKGGHWFIFSDAKLNSSYCSTCDGKTQTSCEVTECFSLHDMVWSTMTEKDREFFGIDADFETFSDFEKNISKKHLKEKLFK
ncbi:hypothetical protein [Brazilian marseillevirus]|uniref:hypothetical protein n=1 Tax=Brazilian marseillevirus TaxID=1813599 RepID=UPI000781A33A|nr:hypothetical protein A3303_gp343 [Brazilian marseillevirus]AMQ10851.1 hypothetical protein [Brazilian marseillevirus]